MLDQNNIKRSLFVMNVCYQVQVAMYRQEHLTFVGEERLVETTLRLFIQVIFKQKHLY